MKVTAELLSLAGSLPDDHAVWTEWEYLCRHGEAGHLDYGRYRRRGVPLGSGAIESAIRRVINLRLKGNSISWYEANAEAMLHLRCQVLSHRWEEMFGAISVSVASDRRLDGTFHSPDMPAQRKAGITIEPPKPQDTTISTTYATAV